MSTNLCDVSIMGRNYRISCPPEQEAELFAAASLVEQRMQEIASRLKNAASDRIAVMAAINLAHDLQLGNSEFAHNGLENNNTRSKIAAMDAQLEALLA